MVKDKEVVAEQDIQIAKLRALIDEQQSLCDDQTAELEKAKKINRFEEDRSRDMNQKNASLTAKLDFIEQGYDYK